MAQYCRYCAELIVGDIAWCEKKKKEIPEHLAKTTNYCPFYNLNSIDAYGENEKGYQPRNKKTEEPQCDGQMSIEDLYDKNSAEGTKEKEGQEDGTKETKIQQKEV